MYATKHNDLKCYRCGDGSEGPDEAGVCKDNNEKGNITTCLENQHSCVVGRINEGGQLGDVYIKGCWAVPYHAQGCVDITDEGVSISSLHFLLLLLCFFL